MHLRFLFIAVSNRCEICQLFFHCCFIGVSVINDLFPPLAVKPCSRTSVLSTTYKLQALVYDILPSATAVFSYAIASRKLSANEQFLLLLVVVVVLR